MVESQSESLAETPLAALHRELGGRMVGFAGYALPVQYPAGIMAEHLHCRSAAALFDVSHMGQAELRGEGAAAALEALTPADVAGLKPGRQRYGLLTSASGGILDDFMFANLGDRIFLVVNASRKEHDFGHIAAHLPQGVTLHRHEDRALLALQGPGAVPALATLAPGVAAFSFMGIGSFDIGGVNAIISRSGYTGEDGVEISVPADQAEAFARRLLALPGVMPAGLGARDSLRLEAGLCLYGSDIDETTSAVEAGLVWSIGKRRRIGGGFAGAERIQRELRDGPARKRIGLLLEGRQPAREGAQITTTDGEIVGVVTSGSFAPSLERCIAMGYVAIAHAAPGTNLEAEVRGKRVPVTVTTLPFVPHHYHRKGAAQ